MLPIDHPFVCHEHASVTGRDLPSHFPWIEASFCATQWLYQVSLRVAFPIAVPDLRTTTGIWRHLVASSTSPQLNARRLLSRHDTSIPVRPVPLLHANESSFTQMQAAAATTSALALAAPLHCLPVFHDESDRHSHRRLARSALRPSADAPRPQARPPHRRSGFD